MDYIHTNELAYWSFAHELQGYKPPLDTDFYTDRSKFLCHHYGQFGLAKNCIMLKGDDLVKIDFDDCCEIGTDFHHNLPRILFQELITLWKPLSLCYLTTSGPQTVYLRFHDDAKRVKASYWKDRLASLISLP